MSDVQIDFPSRLQRSYYVGEIHPTTRASMYEKIEDQAQQVIGTLSGKLALPNVIKVGFDDSSTCFANASKGKLRISSDFLNETILAGDNLDIFRGVIGHEISHISDFEARGLKDTARNLRHIVVTKIVSEGKAEHVGIATGGKGFETQVDRLDDAQGSLAYRYLVDEGAFNKWQLMQMDPYQVGFSVVDDVVRAVGASDIFDIHSEKPDFFIDAIEGILNSRTDLQYEATTR